MAENLNWSKFLKNAEISFYIILKLDFLKMWRRSYFLRKLSIAAKKSVSFVKKSDIFARFHHWALLVHYRQFRYAQKSCCTIFITIWKPESKSTYFRNNLIFSFLFKNVPKIFYNVAKTTHSQNIAEQGNGLGTWVKDFLNILRYVSDM